MKRNVYFYTIGGAILVLALAGCGREQDIAPRSTEEVHLSEGVPVNVRPVDVASFKTFLRFTSSLSGAEETTAKSMVTDEVASIRHAVGDFVEQGTPIVLFPEDNPTLNYEQVRLSYEGALQAYERMRRLYADEGVSEQAFDNSRTQYEIAKANWDSVRKMTAVAAPISGYITRINVFESDNVDSGDPLFTISDYDRLKSTVWLTDRQVDQVAVGQPATAIWQEHRLEGTVVQVDMAMDGERKAFAAKLRFDNAGRQVRSGVTATVEIETYSTEETIMVNQAEIRNDDRGAYVYTVRDSRAEHRAIELGRQQGLYVTVTSGLEPGMRLVTTGIDQVGDGVLVKIIEEQPPLVQRRN